MDNYINAMWVFDWKSGEYGWPAKIKARPIALRDEQRANIDFGGLFAPTVAFSNVRLLTSMACDLDIELWHVDMEQACVQYDLQ